MGGDGGSIPGRADVVKTAGMRFARNLGGMGYLPNTQVISGDAKYDKRECKKLRWISCSLSQEPLKPPLVGCRLGQLYNKEAFLIRLLQKKITPLPPHMSHISSKRDVKDLKVEINSATNRLICPISNVEFDSGVKGVVLWSCGCLISSKAFNELSLPDSESKRVCPVCETKSNLEDIIRMVPDIDEIPDLREKMIKRQREENQEKISKKKQKTLKNNNS